MTSVGVTLPLELWIRNPDSDRMDRIGTLHMEFEVTDDNLGEVAAVLRDAEVEIREELLAESARLRQKKE